MKKADTISKMIADNTQLRKQVFLLTAAVNVRDRYITVLIIRCSGGDDGVIIGWEEIANAQKFRIAYEHVRVEADPIGAMCIRLSAPTESGQNPGEIQTEAPTEGNFTSREDPGVNEANKRDTEADA